MDLIAILLVCGSRQMTKGIFDSCFFPLIVLISCVFLRRKRKSTKLYSFTHIRLALGVYRKYLQAKNSHFRLFASLGLLPGVQGP